VSTHSDIVNQPYTVDTTALATMLTDGMSDRRVTPERSSDGFFFFYDESCQDTSGMSDYQMCNYRNQATMMNRIDLLERVFLIARTVRNLIAPSQKSLICPDEPKRPLYGRRRQNRAIRGRPERLQEEAGGEAARQ